MRASRSSSSTTTASAQEHGASSTSCFNDPSSVSSSAPAAFGSSSINDAAALSCDADLLLFLNDRVTTKGRVRSGRLIEQATARGSGGRVPPPVPQQ